jgi:hypothetical protein
MLPVAGHGGCVGGERGLWYQGAVTVVFRASDKSAAERLEYLRQAVAESIVPFDLRLEDDSFSCEIRTADIGVVRIVEIDAPTSEAVRTRRLIRRSGLGG